MTTVALYPLGDTFVSTRKPNHNYSKKDFLYAGVIGSRIYRAIIMFNLSLIPSDATINSATFNFYLYENNFPTAAKVFNIHRITTDYCMNSVDYRNQPCYDPTVANSFTVNAQVNTFISVDLSTLAREWHIGAYNNDGIMIKASNEVQYNRIGFRSVNFANEGLRPTLIVDYTLTGPAASVQIDGHTFTTSSGNVKTATPYAFTSGQNVGSLSLYNYFINNTGINSATVKLQISPDNATWLDDTPETTITAGNSAAITATHLTRYIRMAYRSTTAGADTALTYWFQTQA